MASFAKSPQSIPACRRAFPAAIGPLYPSGGSDWTTAPLAGPFHMCLVHRQQVTKPTAIFLAFLLPLQRCSTGRTCLRRFFCAGIRFVIRCPPFDPTRVAAEPPLFSCAPFCLKLLPTIGADCFCSFSCLSSFHDFTSMIFDPALVTAKPPPPPPFSALLHDISAAWADIYWHIIMPLGIIVFVPTCVAAKFLPRNMTRWLKRLPAVQALQDSLFLTHDLSAPCLFTPILPQGERYSAILRLQMPNRNFLNRMDLNSGFRLFETQGSSGRPFSSQKGRLRTEKLYTKNRAPVCWYKRINRPGFFVFRRK